MSQLCSASCRRESGIFALFGDVRHAITVDLGAAGAFRLWTLRILNDVRLVEAPISRQFARLVRIPSSGLLSVRRLVAERAVAAKAGTVESRVGACISRRSGGPASARVSAASLRLVCAAEVIGRAAVATLGLAGFLDGEIDTWMRIPQVHAGHRAGQWQIRRPYLIPLLRIRRDKVLVN